MRKKKIIILISTLVLLLCVGVLMLFLGAPEEEKYDDTVGKKITMPNCACEFPINVELKNLTEYEFKKLYFYYNKRHSWVETSASAYFFRYQEWNSILPVEHVKKIDDETFCVVYKFKEKDNEPVLGYVFFQQQTFNKIANKPIENPENWWRIDGEMYFVGDILSERKYRKLDVGDTLLDAIRIDPSITYDTMFNNVRNGNFAIIIPKILKEGVIIITAEWCNEEEYPITTSLDLSSMVITSKEFYPYGCEEYPDLLSLPKVEKLFNN